MRNQGSGSLKRLSELQMGHFKVILDQYVTPKLELWTYSIFCDIFTSCGHFWAIFKPSEMILDQVHNMLCNEEWNDLSKIFRQNYYGGASVCSISDFLPDRHGFSNDALVKFLSRGLASRKPNVVTVSALVLVALVMLYNIANLKSVHWYRLRRICSTVYTQFIRRVI